MVFVTCVRCFRALNSSPMIRAINQVTKNRAILNPVAISSRRNMFYEPGLKPDPKYDILRKAHEDLDYWVQVKEGFKVFIDECIMWKNENRELFTRDVYLDNMRPDEMEKQYDFRDDETFKSWQCVSDSFWDEGYSSASWTRSKDGCALFSGHLDCKTLPRDGTVMRAGWANVTSPEPRKSFFREDRINFEGYTHLVMRVRGDGRTYPIVLRNRGYFDIFWYDIYTYGLYTTGGPYWQYVKIPFSKFVLTYKGSVQDEQNYIPLYNISTVGISMMDRNTGPFSLEIDYIGVLNDQNHDEMSAYEHYFIPESPHKHET